MPEVGVPVSLPTVSHTGRGMEFSIPEVVAFGGIPDPTSGGRRSSRRIQEQPDAVDFQLGRAMRMAKIRDIESSAGLSLNTNISVLHFSEHDIMHRADKLGISLGVNDREVATSINELLDLEMDRAIVMLKNIAVVKPMKESEINELGMCELEGLCEDLVLANLLHEETLEEEGHAATLPSTVGLGEDSSHADREILPEAPRRKWQKKVYGLSAVRRSARLKFKKKFHDDS